MRHALLLASALVVACTSSAFAAKPMSGPALRALFPGSFLAIWKGAYTVHIGAGANGRLNGEAYGIRDNGRWAIRGNQLCVSFQSWTKGNSQCSHVYRQGGWYVGLIKQGRPRIQFRRG